MYNVQLGMDNDVIVEYHSQKIGEIVRRYGYQNPMSISFRNELEESIKKELSVCYNDILSKITSLFSSWRIRAIHIVFRGDIDMFVAPYLYGLFGSITLPYESLVILHVDNQRLMDIMYELNDELIDEFRYISIDDRRNFSFLMKDGSTRDYQMSRSGIGCDRELDMDWSF